MADIAERVAKAGRVEIEGDAAIAVQDADHASDHPREVLALSGKEWDFTLPGCEVFGCISGKTDAETYRESHNELLERLRVVDHVDYGVRHQLLEEIVNQWEAFDETAQRRDGGQPTPCSDHSAPGRRTRSTTRTATRRLPRFPGSSPM